MIEDNPPTGKWVIFWDESYWAAEHLGKRGCVAGADTWAELLPKMQDAEQSWDAGMHDIEMRRLPDA